jgi:hypothetical protein
MRYLHALTLCLVVAGCSEAPQIAEHEKRPAATAPAGKPGDPPAIPDQGTVTKTLGGATVTPKAQGHGAAPGDMAISAAIRKALMVDDVLPDRAQDVTVSTSDGRVILRGTVATAAERERIEILARDSSGSGAAIDNRIDVSPRP